VVLDEEICLVELLVKKGHEDKDKYAEEGKSAEAEITQKKQRSPRGDMLAGVYIK
jgi:hypothetical protein